MKTLNYRAIAAIAIILIASMGYALSKQNQPVENINTGNQESKINNNIAQDNNVDKNNVKGNTGESSNDIRIQQNTSQGTNQELKTQLISLSSPGNKRGEGTATKIFDGHVFLHTITAKLPDPANGKRYEGWLINNENSESLPTGILQNISGTYNLYFTSNTDQSAFSRIVITEELDAGEQNNRDGDIVLEGDFNRHN